MPENLISDRYSIVREIGRGASATVFLAHDRTLDRDIAIKIVAPALANDESFVDRFMREARLSAGLSHPNIVTVHDVGETDDGRPFIAMALVAGASLEEIIKNHAPLPVSEASRILTELGSALDYLHGQGLIHRDVKPSNIMIEDSGRVMLSDFGIAYARESARYTMTGVLLGTPRYMAPEQMLGEEPAPQTDVYAMGVIAFEMLAGAPPFEGTGTGLMYKIVHEPPPLVTSKAPDIPAGIEAAIVRALQKDPQQRWSSPGEFAAAVASPDANATMAGPAMAPFPAPAPPEIPPPTDIEAATEPEPVSEPETAVPPPSFPGDSGPSGGGGGKKKAIAGLAGAGLIGALVAGYCLAAGGANPKADSDGERSPTSAATTSTAVSGTSTPNTSQTVAGGASGSPSQTPPTTNVPTVVATATSVPSGVTQPPPPPPPPAATSTSIPVATSTFTPQPTSTKTLRPTNTPTPTGTATPTNTPTPPPTATPTTAPPNAPSNVTLNGNTLTWNDNSNNESGFKIYWRTTGLNDNIVHVTNDKAVGPNTTSTSVDTIYYTFDQYDFRRGVSAYNAAGESAIAWTP
ncbi:MAG: protein kinase [Dehalococcoidia bacterium]